MNDWIAPLLALMSACIAGFAVVSFFSPGPRPISRILVPLLALVPLVTSITALGMVILYGSQTLALPLHDLTGFSLRLDYISTLLFVLISFVGAIVLNYARTYLDGESHQGTFLAWMSLTLGAVILLVLSNNLLLLVLAWIATSLFLHQLLLFYPGRPGARRAAHKKFLFARLGDVALIGGSTCLFIATGTTDITGVNLAARAGDGGAWFTAAAILIAVAAMLKSAQFPFHGWLVEVMEAPTPVSALLHAGVINAGGFLLIRFSEVIITAPGVLAVLVLAGGFTALFASMVMLTQPAVKTSLAWSTIAQMGFMILQCGLALFPLALLHIIAHSLYKAHAFLSSGSAVDKVAKTRRPGPVAIPDVSAIARSFLVAIAIYVMIGASFGFEHKSVQAIALGAILIFGVAYLVAQGFADKAPRALTTYTILFSVGAAISYFFLQRGIEILLKADLPATPEPGPLEWAIIILALCSFGLTAFAQASFPLWSSHPAFAGLRVHLANGFYVNALTDRLLTSKVTSSSPTLPQAQT
ncbi:proton-conducting transporter transmembrane domain-containing protein [Hyphomonas jannaschiana]|uniref:proton-conducting transporter transmembrane domain-containing protein n=1 Tax=Hyphomonas jannaschiana TaxID=86 RepID=UPI0035C77B6B